MNRILLFCALGALWGCRTVTEPNTEAITLSCSTSESSKVGALTAGDAVAVFARLEGTETYFLEGAKYVVGSDGHTLTYGSTVYYPEPKQAVEFFAYFPYHTGTFSVPSDQSTAAALKKADLCWATASSTPISLVPLTFQHLFARLIVQTNKPTEKIACQVVPSGVLNAATAQFTLNNNKSEVFTTGVELILPVQPLSRLVLTVSGVEYIYDGSINLQAGQTTTLNLTLNPSTQTATLNGSSTTDWTTSTQNGTPEQAVSNILTLHWANYVPQGPTPDKITLTINNTDYTINSGITYANKTFSVPFASSALRYPYTITKITFYSGATQSLPGCTQLLGATVYKSASQTLGIKDPANAVLINGIWWATGYLVADGPNGCRIGAPTDCGIYFQFGSLIGWSAGALGDGIGTPSMTTPLAVVVKPSNYTGSTSWTSVGRFTGATSSMSYTARISDFLGGSDNGQTGVGDPCTFYLKGGWRSPNADEQDIMMNRATSYATSNFLWSSALVGLKHRTLDFFMKAIPARNYIDGQIIVEQGETNVMMWVGTPWNTNGVYSSSNISTPTPITNVFRTFGLPIRCIVQP